MTGGLLEWIGDHRQWLGLCIFMIAMLESLAIAGLLVPGVVLLVAVTAMAGGWGMPLITAMTWAFAGAVAGDMASFVLGRVFHQDIRRLGLFRRHPQWIARGEMFFRRYGVLSIFLGRFVGPVRPIVPMVAGMLDMPVWRFIVVNVASALAWAPVYVIPGYMAGHAVSWTVPEFFWHQALALGGALLGVASLAFFMIWKQERWSSLAAAALCLVALIVLSLSGQWINILDASLTDWAARLTDTSPDNPARPLMIHLQPLAGSPYALTLGGLTLICLVLRGTRRHWLLPGLALLLSTAVGGFRDISTTHQTTAISFTLAVSLLILCSRGFSFWVRQLWLLGAIPAGVLLSLGLLTSEPVRLSQLLGTWLQVSTACLLSLWATERVARLTPFTPKMITVLGALPAIAAAICLSGLHPF